MEHLSDFEAGQIVCARLSGASVTNTATLLGASRATISKVMSAAYTNYMKRKSGRRKLTLAERDRRTLRRICFEKSLNNCSTGDSRSQ
jgi:IS30 family transposase